MTRLIQGKSRHISSPWIKEGIDQEGEDEQEDAILISFLMERQLATASDSPEAPSKRRSNTHMA